eukprot:TRINITY_DN9979_c0_g1_i1.p1 TRINITY_DN9979_c0_g1~~TRINITY_DN9979_c0_g1_i1.p1  ORF type:complete len:236 (+),score=29.21 TRINITY_DN9979_c0_g1_i1:372-1079(+)
MHGITIQEGPDGNSDSEPTYWFWHPWACANNVTGCPWIGHGNASRIFDSYLVTVGHGAVLNMNIPPERTGRMNQSVVDVMHQVGAAINNTFKLADAGKQTDARAQCGLGVSTIEVAGEFDYVVTMEDLSFGQLIGNYSIDFRLKDSTEWLVLVPPVWKKKPHHGLSDRPDGHDPRDQYVGHKRIDFPIVNTSGTAALPIAEVRFNCIRLVDRPGLPADTMVHLRQFSLHKKHVPW